jgi:hypothetical protein
MAVLSEKGVAKTGRRGACAAQRSALARPALKEFAALAVQES